MENEICGTPSKILWTGIEYLPLSSENLLLGLPKGHPYLVGKEKSTIPLPAPDLAKFKDDSFALSLKRSTMRTELFDPIFQAAGFNPNVIVESELNGFLERLASEGLCDAVIPLWAGYAKNARLNRAIRHFINLAKDDAKRYLDFPPPQ